MVRCDMALVAEEKVDFIPRRPIGIRALAIAREEPIEPPGRRAAGKSYGEKAALPRGFSRQTDKLFGRGAANLRGVRENSDLVISRSNLL